MIWQNKYVTGVIAETPEETIHVHAAVVTGADGRHSVVREKAGLRVISAGAPIDVLWFRLKKEVGPTNQTVGRFSNGKMLILIDRDTYYQRGFVIAKGQYEKVKKRN